MGTSLCPIRVRHVFAISTLGYSERVPPLHTSQPGIHLCGSAQIVNGTLNVDEAVALAERAARRLGAGTEAPRGNAGGRSRVTVGKA